MPLPCLSSRVDSCLASQALMVDVFQVYLWGRELNWVPERPHTPARL